MFDKLKSLYKNVRSNFSIIEEYYYNQQGSDVSRVVEYTPKYKVVNPKYSPTTRPNVSKRAHKEFKNVDIGPMIRHQITWRLINPNLHMDIHDGRELTESEFNDILNCESGQNIIVDHNVGLNGYFLDVRLEYGVRKETRSFLHTSGHYEDVAIYGQEYVGLRLSAYDTFPESFIRIPLTLKPYEIFKQGCLEVRFSDYGLNNLVYNVIPRRFRRTREVLRGLLTIGDGTASTQDELCTNDHKIPSVPRDKSSYSVSDFSLFKEGDSTPRKSGIKKTDPTDERFAKKVVKTSRR